MKVAILGLIAATMFQSKGCDLNRMTGHGPEHIRQQTEQQLRTYFPRARVVVSEQERIVFGITCVANVGLPLIQQMVPTLDSSEGVQQLKRLRRYAGFEGLSNALGMKMVTYRFFALGFDNYVIRFDADANKYSIISGDEIEGYRAVYQNECVE
jgi:hypothetical protein